MNVMIEMNLNAKIIERSGYTFLDLLADVGGVKEMLYSGFAIVVAFFNYKHYDNYLAAQLFKIKNSVAGTIEKPQSETFTNTKTRFCNFKEYLIDKIICCQRSRKYMKTRQEKGFEKARDLIKEEVNIVEIIRKMRYFDKALQQLLPPEQCNQLQMQSQFLIVDPSSSENDTMPDKANIESDQTFTNQVREEQSLTEVITVENIEHHENNQYASGTAKLINGTKNGAN